MQYWIFKNNAPSKKNTYKMSHISFLRFYVHHRISCFWRANTTLWVRPCLSRFSQHGLGGPIVGTHCCATMGPRIKLVQELPKVTAGWHCWATMTWDDTEAEITWDATITWDSMCARITYDAIMASDHISATKKCVTWREENLRNVRRFITLSQEPATGPCPESEESNPHP
jgi:hypothetical protein